MAVIQYSQEIKVRVLAKRMFKALTLQPHIYLPKAIPMAIKSLDNLQGDGGVGTIQQTNFADGSCVKLRIDDLDVENCSSKYTLTEGPMLGDKLEKIYCEEKFEDTSDGGCLITIVSHTHTKGDLQLTEEEIKANKDQLAGYYTLTAEYLLANPDV